MEGSMQVQPILPAAVKLPPASAGRASERTAPKEAEAKRLGEFFVTPLLRFDSEAFTVIFQVRDSESGDVKRQFPAESVVEERRSASLPNLSDAETSEAEKVVAQQAAEALILGDDGKEQSAPRVNGGGSGANAPTSSQPTGESIAAAPAAVVTAPTASTTEGQSGGNAPPVRSVDFEA